MSDKSKDNWFAKNPRQGLQIAFLILVSIYLLPVAFLGLVLFVLLVKLLRIRWVWLLIVGGFAVNLLLFFKEYRADFDLPLSSIFPSMEIANAQLIRLLFSEGLSSSLHFIYDVMLSQVIVLSIVVVGILAVFELIPNSAHEQDMRALQKRKKTESRDIKDETLAKTLDRLDESTYDGTVLGVSKTTNRVFGLPDSFVNQLVLVLGTTGGGKTITLRRFYQRAMLKKYPLIIVDGKPTDENTRWIESMAAKCGKPFYGFNCGNYFHYDPLSEGGYTELKDKIISLKDQWESDYYRSISEDYLQTTFEVLLASKEPYDLKRVVELLDYDELALLVRKTENEKLLARVKRLSTYDKKDITGLQAHLSLLIHSELGGDFEKVEGKTFSLREVINQNAVVYFALPALRFPSFSSVLGKLIINDIKAVIDRENGGKRIFTIFDEFSVFAGEQVLNLVNMGRGKGIHAIFGTQGIADLQKIHPTFANQVLNCVNTIICHRLNDQESAEAVAGWAGTRETFDLTAQVDMNQGSTGMGSVRRNKEFIIHPDAIKQELHAGEAFLISKVGKFNAEKIKVKYS